MEVFFDIDGTLLDYESAERDGALQFLHLRADILKMGAEEFLKIWTNLADLYYQRYLNKELSFKEQQRVRIQKLYNLVGRKLSNEEADLEFTHYLTYYRNSWKPFQDVKPCLLQLWEMGLFLGVISNGDYQHQIEKLDSIGVVGDRIETDVVGSTLAGMKGVWLNRNGERDQDQNEIQIGSLSQLPKLLQEF
ncbi:hypothetical protein DESME_02240 [Desulfitobacterium metallireducens DSM 15288]|uniref:Haloacid dehalogenase n=2 Tax=Desulfitobacterium TaxID=36853 RepID=W0ECC3_9FIRM|nr:hypothetical protein DESME_02240 [Desulfitobacterium metallireducens DSM 15288]